MTMSATMKPDCNGSKELEHGLKFCLTVPSLQHISSVKIATWLCIQTDVEQIISRSLNLFDSEMEQPNFKSFKSDVDNVSLDSDDDNYDGSTNNSMCESSGSDSDDDLRNVKINENSTKFKKAAQVAKVAIIAKLKKLNIPLLMSPFVSGVAKQVLKEVVYWANFQHCFILNWDTYASSNCLDNLVLSSRGLIDYPASLRNLISKDLGIPFKYDLACMFCFEDLIQLFKPKVLQLGLTHSQGPLRKFWTRSALQNKFKKHKYLLKTFMECIEMSANPYALMCLWDKLTKQDKDNVIKIIFNSECDVEFKCYVLSQLDYDQQEVVFANAAQDVLKSLYLSDLWREMFLPTVRYLRDKISERDFTYILGRVAMEVGTVLKKMCGGYNSHVAIFQELWHLAPENAKKGAIDFGTYVLQLPGFLLSLLSNDDSGLHCIFKCFSWSKSFDLIMLILQECTPVQRKHVLLSSPILHRCCVLIEKNEWDLLEKYTGLCLPSTRDMNDFKKKVKDENIHLNVGIKLMIPMKWVELDKFLNYICGCKKEKDILRNDLAYTAVFTWIDNCIETGDFSVLNETLKECFETEEAINDFYNSTLQILKDIEIIEVVCKLKKAGHFDIIEVVLNWWFQGDQEKIADFKAIHCEK